VGRLADVFGWLGDAFTEWRNVRLGALQFPHQNTARLTLVLLIGLSLTLIVVRLALGGQPGRSRVALPRILPWVRRSPLAFVRHAPLVPFLIGLAFFAVALADPVTTLRREEVSYPGRRIGLLIDASSSMMAPFSTTRLGTGGGIAFSANVAAAEYFLRLRMRGKYHDLIALIEFGNEAYVVTPFTSDYENVLLSVSLIGDVNEWGQFPDQGTIIAQAIEQSVDLFKAFDFLHAAGNVLVIFSDGQDTQVKVHGRTVSEILEGAVETKIPVYFIRTVAGAEAGGIIPDDIWKPAVERTGGKFYGAANETVILNAIHDIDRLSAGRIEVKRYTVQEPRFQAFAMAAVGFWTLALLLQLTVPYFRRFP